MADQLYYVSVPNGGIQEAHSIADAKWMAAHLRKWDRASLVRIVDALDRTSTGGYRLIHEWSRDDSGRWRVIRRAGRVWV